MVQQKEDKQLRLMAAKYRLLAFSEEETYQAYLQSLTSLRFRCNATSKLAQQGRSASSMSTLEIEKQQKIINGKDFLTLAELPSSDIAKLLQLSSRD